MGTVVSDCKQLILYLASNSFSAPSNYTFPGFQLVLSCLWLKMFQPVPPCATNAIMYNGNC